MLEPSPYLRYLQVCSVTWEISLSIKFVNLILLTSSVFHGLKSLPFGSLLSIRRMITSTFHGIFRVVKFFFDPRISIIFIRHRDFRYLDAVDSYSKISLTSPRTRLVVFPRFDTVTS